MAVSKKVKLSPDDTPKAVSMEEVGYLGLRIVDKQILEEADSRLRFPAIISEIDKMKKDSMVSAALHLYHMMVGKSEWKVVPPVDASNKAKERAKTVHDMMFDMEHSWEEFITSACSFIDYGFSIFEIVPRYRLKRFGSTRNDGVVGIKKLAPRSQSTIKGFVFDNEGRNLVGVEQSLKNLNNVGRYSSLIERNGGTDLFLPKQSLLLFTADSLNGDPTGNPPLKSAWVSWKRKNIVIDTELNGLARDLQGVPVFKMPARYMSSMAGDDEKKQYQTICSLARNLHNNQQAGVVLPSDADPETKKDAFSVEILQSKGANGYDTNSIIQRYNTEILTCLYADVLALGNNGSGSFSLAGSKTNILGFAIQYRLKEIQRVLNSQLIPFIYQANGWEMDEAAQFEYADIDDQDLSSFSSAIQRIAAVDMIERDRPTFNLVREKLGITPYPDDEPVHYELLQNKMQSRAGDGMEKGMGNGTSDNVAGRDNSVANNARETA